MDSSNLEARGRQQRTTVTREVIGGIAMAYEVELEIEGPAAMFTRPDSGAAPISYPAPTHCAARGIFEAVARLRSAFIDPVRVEVCRPVRYLRYTTNYGGPLRKADQLRKGASYQLPAVILVDVCYRLYGVVRDLAAPIHGRNSRHHLKAMFDRRLRSGAWFRTPCLGWSEFLPTYCGPLREETRIEETISLTLPSMLFSVFDGPGGLSNQSKYDPVFCQDVAIERGVLDYRAYALRSLSRQPNAE